MVYLRENLRAEFSPDAVQIDSTLMCYCIPIDIEDRWMHSGEKSSKAKRTVISVVFIYRVSTNSKDYADTFCDVTYKLAEHNPV